MVHPKIKILSSFPHRQVVLNLNELRVCIDITFPPDTPSARLSDKRAAE